MKLIWEYNNTDGYTYSCTHPIPFEYSSKEDFVFMVLEKLEEAIKINKDYPVINILGVEFLERYEAETIEHNVYTLEEWFEKRKENMTNKKRQALRDSKKLLLGKVVEWDKQAAKKRAGDTTIILNTSERQDWVDEILAIEDTLREN